MDERAQVTYRLSDVPKRNAGANPAARGVAILIQSVTFPRSIAHCVSELEHSISVLPNNEKTLIAIHRLMRQLDNAKIEKLKQLELQGFVDQIQIGFAQLHNELQFAYFGGG